MKVRVPGVDTVVELQTLDLTDEGDCIAIALNGHVVVAIDCKNHVMGELPEDLEQKIDSRLKQHNDRRGLSSLPMMSGSKTLQ